jgi:hypothetical protein
MSNDYKLGYENGRYDALEALKIELRKRKEPLLQKIVSDGKASDQITIAKLHLLDALSDWVIDETEGTESD